MVLGTTWGHHDSFLAQPGITDTYVGAKLDTKNHCWENLEPETQFGQLTIINHSFWCKLGSPKQCLVRMGSLIVIIGATWGHQSEIVFCEVVVAR